ncbi:MAG: uncharacterized protein KVP18_001588 [Porospora cf. gigantea A]|uniref:uncharacterized protein n=1 Tax=Porospora cf. gigantea A TaxID=2853593 RepID=UPI003559B7F1|nr:MAG: hypothetical protein KVP18_001588 [Porospora cf. gigantea A]
MPTVQEVLVASLYRHLLSLSRSNSVCVPRLLLGPLSAVAKAAQKPPLSYPSEQRVHPSAFLCDAYVEALFYYTPLHAVVRDAVMRAHDGSSSIFVPPPLRSFVEDWSVCVDVPLYGGMPAYLANIDRQLELFVFDDALPSLEMCPTLHSAFPSPFVTSTPRLEATWSDGRLFWPGSLSNCVSVPPREFTARDVLRLLSLSAYNRVQGLWRSLLVHGSGVGFVLVYVVPVVLLVLVLISVVLWRFRVSTQYNRWFFLKRSRHHWQSFHTSSQPRYCSACSQLISGFWIFRNTGLVCRVCHRTSHLACLGRVEKMFCKCPMQKTPLEHLWVHGNLPADSLCGVCGIICASQFGLHGLRCLWCKRTLHESCLGRHNNIDNSWCDLGQFSTAVVPPGVVTVDLGKGTRGGVDEDRAITQSISQGLQELAEGMSKLNRLSSRLKNVMEPAVESLTPVPEEPQLRRRALQREKMSEIAQSCPSHAPIWRVLSKTQLDRLLPANCSPLLVFVNLSSGGQLGDELCKDLYAHLNPMQVVPLTPGAAQDALQWFCSVVDLRRGRVLVCGGDGSVGWAINSIMAHISAIGSDIRLPVGVLPLGTGNDLSRVLGWGPYFDGQVPRHLSQIMAARETLLDFWSVRCVDADRKAEVDLKQELCFKHPKPLPTDWVWQLMAGFGSSAPPLPPEGDHDGSIGMLNYMDLGICASISLKFHRLRMEHPELFRSRVGNQAIYGEMGFREYLTEDRIDLSQLRIWCDGVEIALPEPHIEGLIVVNIPSFSGGLNLWRPRSYRKHCEKTRASLMQYSQTFVVRRFHKPCHARL